MRVKLFAVAVAFVSASVVAHASPITYDLTLTSTNGSFSGTGIMTLTSAPSASGLTSYTSSQITALSFTIDGQTFTFGGPGSHLSALEFLNGNLYDVTFAQQVGSSPSRFDLQTTSQYQFSYDNELANDYGTITANVASTPAVTPEPTSIALLGTGLLGFVGMMRKKIAAR